MFRFLTILLFALVFSSPAAAQSVVQEVTGTSEVLNTFTSNSFGNSSLQATITPTSSTSQLEIIVTVPSADARQISGSGQERAYQIRVWNATRNTEAVPAHVYGIQLPAPSSAAQPMWQPAFLYGRIPVASTDQQTFRVQMRAVYGSGGVAAARLRANEERATIIIREIAPLNPVVSVNPAPILDDSNWPQTWAASGEQWVTWPNFDYDAETGTYSIVYTLQNYGADGNDNAIVHDTASSLTGFGTPTILDADPGGFLVGFEPDGAGGCIGAAYLLDPARRGMTVIESSDCASITSVAPAPTFTDDETNPVTGPYGVGDVNRIFNNPLDGEWYCACRWFTGPSGPQSPSLAGAGRGVRAISLYRLDGEDMTADADWTYLGPMFWSDDHDGGVAEFYGMTAPIEIDGHLVSFVRVLRDDMGAGIGWSEIAVSDDGVTWHRERWPFIERGTGGEWDAAIKWIADVEIVGDELVGITMDYDEGHKIGDRVIGAFTLPIDDLRRLIERLPA